MHDMHTHTTHTHRANSTVYILKYSFVDCVALPLWIHYQVNTRLYYTQVYVRRNAKYKPIHFQLISKYPCACGRVYM